MASLTLTAKAKPIFLTENRFNRHTNSASDLVVSTGSQFATRLYDMDPESLWSSVGSSDAITETITGGLYAPGAQMSFDIKFVGVYGHNVKHIKLELSNNDGGSYSTAFDITNETNNYTRSSLTSIVPADKFKLSLYTTQTADQEKQVGNIIIAGETFQAEDRPIAYTIENPRVDHKTAVMADGSIRRAYNYRSVANYKHNAVNVAFLTDTAAEWARLRELAFGGLPFIYMIEPGDQPTEIYQGNVRPGSYSESYMALSKSAGRRIGMILEEIGGA